MEKNIRVLLEDGLALSVVHNICMISYVNLVKVICGDTKKRN